MNKIPDLLKSLTYLFEQHEKDRLSYFEYIKRYIPPVLLTETMAFEMWVAVNARKKMSNDPNKDQAPAKAEAIPSDDRKDADDILRGSQGRGEVKGPEADHALKAIPISGNDWSNIP